MDNTPSFFQLLDEHFDIQEFIPSVFTNAFYQHPGCNRLYPLTRFLSALILQKTDFCRPPQMFLGDAAFDSVDIYAFLLNEFRFQKTLIPHNLRNESTLKTVEFNEYGYPTCPDDPPLAMKYCGIAKRKGML